MSEKTPATTDKLRVAIDREGQGDKVNFPDPAAAPLGTDAEASGNAPGPQELAMEPAAPSGQPRTRWAGLALYVGIALAVFIGFAVLVMLALG